MSNNLAIATVTAGFAELLLPALRRAITDARVTTRRPDTPTGLTPEARVNLYLYNVVPNTAWRNADLPLRRADGGLAQRAQAGLDLHYLLTFYGDESQLQPQRLLAAAIGALELRPMLSRDLIRTLVRNAQDPTDTYNFLVGSNLADQIEVVRFAPLSLNLEELSKLWSVFFQTSYSLSVAYQASVVLVEPDEGTPQPALPVRDYNVYAVPFRRALIEQVAAAEGAGRPIVRSSRLLIRGTQLRGDITRVSITRLEVTPRPEDITDRQIALALPVLRADALRAGVQVLQVLHYLPMGTPPVEHRGFASDAAAFVLHPTITGLEFSAPNLTVLTDPIAATGQRTVLLLNELNPAPGTRPHSYSLDPASTAGDSIVFAQANSDPALAELGLANPSLAWGLLSAPLAGFAGLTNSPAHLLATLAGEGPHDVTVSGTPANLDAVCAALEAGLHAAHTGAAFTGARVLRLGDRLFVLAGGLAGTASFDAAGSDPAVDELGLRSGGSAWGALFANLSGFGGVSQDPARLRVSIGNDDPHEVVIQGAPATLDAARAALETGLRAAHATPAFTQARVGRLDDRLLVVPGPGLHFVLSGVAPGDYLVRVQVDGAESPLIADGTGLYTGPRVTV